MMDVCSFLERVRGQRYRLSALEDELKQCRADAELISSPALTERVQSSNQKDTSDLFISIEHYEQLVQERIAESLRYRARALDIIAYETDNVSYSVLLRWYILDQSWEEIIREMHYSKSVLSDRKNESLTYLSRVIPPELLEVRT
jgi:hypothetical protein